MLLHLFHLPSSHRVRFFLLFFPFSFFFLFFSILDSNHPRIQYTHIPSPPPPLYIYSMNNSCDTPRSIPPLDTTSRVRSTGKRCRGILYKYLQRERETESFLTVRLFIVRPERGTDRKRKAKKILHVPLLSFVRIHQLPPRHVGERTRVGRVGNRGEQREERGEKRRGKERKGGGQRAEEHATNGGGEEGRRGCAASTTRTEHTICQSVPSIIRVYSCGPRINPSPLPLSPPPPLSPVICLGQIQSQPRGGFELTINFKRVRRRRPRAPRRRRGGEGGGREGREERGGGDTDGPRCFRGCRTDVAPRELIYRDARGGEGWKKEKRAGARTAVWHSRLIRQGHDNRRSMTRRRLDVTSFPLLHIYPRNTVRSH